MAVLLKLSFFCKIETKSVVLTVRYHLQTSESSSVGACYVA
jgi:hypothetical protein